MAAIVALAGKVATVTVNGVTWRITRASIRIGNDVISFATTGQTADGDSQYWMNKLSGLNDWSVEGEGYIDYNATAANRVIGSNIKILPGTATAGTLVITLSSGMGIIGSVVVREFAMSFDVEANKPQGYRFTLEGNDAITYVNS